MPVDRTVQIEEGRACGKCCSKHCHCTERQPDGRWVPDSCLYCLGNEHVVRTNNNTYAVNP